MYRVVIKQANVVRQPRGMMGAVAVRRVYHFARDMVFRASSFQYRCNRNVLFSKGRVLVRFNTHRVAVTPMRVKFSQGQVNGRVRVGLLSITRKEFDGGKVSRIFRQAGK